LPWSDDFSHTEQRIAHRSRLPFFTQSWGWFFASTGTIFHFFVEFLYEMDKQYQVKIRGRPAISKTTICHCDLAIISIWSWCKCFTHLHLILKAFDMLHCEIQHVCITCLLQVVEKISIQHILHNLLYLESWKMFCKFFSSFVWVEKVSCNWCLIISSIIWLSQQQIYLTISMPPNQHIYPFRIYSFCCVKLTKHNLKDPL